MARASKVNGFRVSQGWAVIPIISTTAIKCLLRESGDAVVLYCAREKSAASAFGSAFVRG